ncbi:glycosyltransferase family 39 protein [Oxyplasma meridianum]|uniref:dolichyl-phosphooligosaccharide-protein glycotransferase n=1 Tax=Oxyplasma meridianum TaxID=3073602 RepID=A0AAX4NEG5_9ARCH
MELQDNIYKKPVSQKLGDYSEVIVLGILFALYLFLGNYYSWSIVIGGKNLLSSLPTSGGSDPYYNFRVIEYILQYHVQLVYDAALNYPLGSINPRNPFFHWLVVFFAEILSPIFGLNNAAYYVFEELDAVFGALLIIPVYLIGREIFGKKAGLMAAFLYTLMPSNLSSGILSGGRMHTPELIFAFFAVYFFLKAMKHAKKVRIVENQSNLKGYIPSTLNYIRSNRVATIYGLLAGASLGGLMLSWQGYAYIEVIILIYVGIQLIANLILKRPTGYLTYFTILFALIGFAMGFYYYRGVSELAGWYNSEVLMALMIIVFAALINIIGRKPWLLIIPFLVIVVIASLFGLSIFYHSAFERLLSGDGYFIKTRVYSTIAEASAPALGSYIGGFGVAQFFIGIAGLAYMIYFYIKDRKDTSLLILVFSLVSIYMSFEADRFNITAAPAYAIVGGGILIYFARMIKLNDIKRRRVLAQPTIRKALKGNISWLHVVFVFIMVAVLVLPSGLNLVSASVPSSSSAKINSEINSALPSFLQTTNPTNLSDKYVGGYGYGIVNGSTPLSQSFAWLRTQNTNVPFDQRPAYVSWWDYGFQELYQGQHPAVADDFQQGFRATGAILLAQNQSQVLSVLIARVLEGNFANNSNSFSKAVNNDLMKYLGGPTTSLIYNVSKNPASFKKLVLSNQKIYGNYSSVITPANVYFAFIKGYLSAYYPMSTLIPLYSALEGNTGYNIQYVQIDRQLFPSSGTDPGTFYAPSYLTDTPSYSADGEIVPTNYYQIYAENNTGSYFPLNDFPAGETPVNYTIEYAPAFYNTTIYKFMVGYPPSAVRMTSGIPGLTSSTSTYPVLPGWNMSNFEIVYSASLYNPHKNYQAYPNDFSTIPLQQAYLYQKEKKGTVILFPEASQFISAEDPIFAYYPGAVLNGRVTTPSGLPVANVTVTLMDQYGIPKGYVKTNNEGYYNISAVPGNDSLYFSTGKINPVYLYGSNVIKHVNVTVSEMQGERIATSYNASSGLPNYYINENAVVNSSNVSGSVNFVYQQAPDFNSYLNSTSFFNGNVILSNSTYGATYNLSIVDGIYSMHDIPAYNYNVSVYYKGKMYRNVTNLAVTIGSDINFNVPIQMNLVKAEVNINGNPVSNYKVTAKGPSGTYSNITNSHGYANMWVFPGNYTLSASSTLSETNTAKVDFPGWGLNATVNLTAEITGVISGKITNSSGPTSIWFYEEGDVSNYYNITTTGKTYIQELPFGVYTVYANSSGKAFIETVTVNTNTSLNINLQSSNYVTVTSHISGLSFNAYSANYEILSTNSFITTSDLTNRSFTMLIPDGTYSFSAKSIHSGITSYGFSRYIVSGNQTFNLNLNQNNSISMFAFNSQAGSSYTSTTALTSGIGILYADNVPVYFSNISGKGFSQLYFSSSYSSVLRARAYNAFFTGTMYNVTFNASSPTFEYSMSPLLYKVNIVLTNNSKILEKSGEIYLNGNTRTSTSFTDGKASLETIAGIYSISLTTSNMNLAVPDSTVKIYSSSADQNFTINVIPEASIEVLGATNFTIFNSSGAEMVSNVSLPIGEYTVYSNKSMRANITTVNLQENLTLSPRMLTSYTLTYANSLNIASGEFRISSNIGTIYVDAKTALLPAGSYNVSYYNQYSNSSGDFILHGYQNIVLNGSKKVTVPVQSTTFKTSVNILNLYDNSPVKYTYYKLMNHSGNTVASSVTNSYGNISVMITGGNYTLYLMNNASGVGFFGNIYVPSFQQYLNTTIHAKNAALQYISVNVGNRLLNTTNVTITKGISSMTFNTSKKYIMLPFGNYTFSSSYQTSETTYNSTVISVTYETNYTEYVHSTGDIPISLQKQVIQAYILKSSQKTPHAYLNQSFPYNFTITNAGNSAQNITLSSGSTSWLMNFNVSKIYIQPGQSINITANVTEKVPSPAGSDLIPVNVTGNTRVLKENLPVNVQGQALYKVVYSKITVAYGKDINVPFTIVNNGTTAIKVNMTVNSANQSILKYASWNYAFTMNGSNITNITVPFGSSMKLNLTLFPISTAAAYPLSFSFNITGSNNVTYHEPVYVQKPAYVSISPYPIGNGIRANFTGNPSDTLYFGLIIIAVAVVSGLVIAATRGRRKK